ncbi:MAG: HAD family hydrolase [Planctomycetales bacterium]
MAPESSDSVEIIRADFPRGNFHATVMDFDGTLSLMRRGWQAIMTGMMVELLRATGTDETPDQLTRLVEDFIARLTGKQTIHQMIQLRDEILQRGGRPLEPSEYKTRFDGLLLEQVSRRAANLRNGSATPEELTIPGSRELLKRLQQSGTLLVLASGPDLGYVRHDLRLLDLAGFFGPRVHGALDDPARFSKAMVVKRLLQETGAQGSQLLGFGDGQVEIEEIKKVGGTAVGVASNEDSRRGINSFKRQRLIAAGADLIIGDYRCLDRLFSLLNIP